MRLVPVLFLLACATGSDRPVLDEDADGYYADATSPEDVDCDDDDASAYPFAVELCDEVDNDCNGEVDDDPPTGPSWWPDADGDGHGYGTPAIEPVIACTRPEGYADNTHDCNDRDAGVFPGNTEICDGRDDNCNGLADEGCP